MVKTLILIDSNASYNQANFRIHLKTQHFNRVSVIFQNLYSKQEKMGGVPTPGIFQHKIAHSIYMSCLLFYPISGRWIEHEP